MCLHYTLTRPPQRWACLLHHRDQCFLFSFLWCQQCESLEDKIVSLFSKGSWLRVARFVRSDLACVFWVSLMQKCQCLIMMYDLLSQKCIFWSTFVYMKYLWLLTSGTGLRAFWKSASWVILLRLAQIKFSISSLDGLLIFCQQWPSFICLWLYVISVKFQGLREHFYE